MTDETGMSPLADVAGEARPDVTGAFKLVSNETRLAILLALWEAYDPHDGTDGVSFSELRDRVGTRDSGQFNYHVRKLEGQFVSKTDDGYHLRPLGLKLVQTIIADADRTAHIDAVPVDVDCSLCGAPTAITYQDGWLYHHCTECDGAFGFDHDHPSGVLFGEPLPPSALANRTPEEVFAAGVFRLFQVLTMKVGGLCPVCSGVIESTVSVCGAHESEPGTPCSECGNVSAVRITWVCSVCKYRGSASPAGIVGLHPAVIAFYHDRGVDLGYTINSFEEARQAMALLQGADQTIVSTDPLRVRVTVRYAGDELSLLLDKTMTVIEQTVFADSVSTG